MIVVPDPTDLAGIKAAASDNGGDGGGGEGEGEGEDRPDDDIVTALVVEVKPAVRLCPQQHLRGSLASCVAWRPGKVGTRDAGV